MIVFVLFFPEYFVNYNWIITWMKYLFIYSDVLPEILPCFMQCGVMEKLRDIFCSTDVQLMFYICYCPTTRPASGFKESMIKVELYGGKFPGKLAINNGTDQQPTWLRISSQYDVTVFVVIIFQQFVNVSKAIGIDNATEFILTRHLMRSFTTRATPVCRQCSELWDLKNPASKLTNVSWLGLVDAIWRWSNIIVNIGSGNGLSPVRCNSYCSNR